MTGSYRDGIEAAIRTIHPLRFAKPVGPDSVYGGIRMAESALRALLATVDAPVSEDGTCVCGCPVGHATPCDCDCDATPPVAAPCGHTEHDHNTASGMRWGLTSQILRDWEPCPASTDDGTQP